MCLSIWEYSKSGWVPRRIRSQLTVTAGLAFSCALISFLISWLHGRGEIICKLQQSRNNSQSQLYKPVKNSSELTMKNKSPKKSSSSSWVVKNSKTKRIADGDDKLTTKGNGSCDKYKPVNKKDHWASAREHFLPVQNDDEDTPTIQRDDTADLEHKRRRRRRDDSSGGSGGTTSGNNGIAGRKIEGSARRVPQKLSLKTIERPQPRRSSNAKTLSTGKSSRTSTNNDLQSYVAATVKAWELEAGNADPARAESLKASLLEASMWSGQWRQPPDDVQPCSSKTLDPYTFA